MNIQDTKKNLGLCDNNKLVGSVTYKMYDKNHNLVSTETTHNNIVLGIRKPIMSLLAGWNKSMDSLPFVKSVYLGTGTTQPTVLDTALEKPIPGSFKETNSDPIINDAGPSVTFAFMYDATDTNVDNIEIHEMGLFTKDNVMIARTTVGTWKKVPGLYFEIYWTIGYQSNVTNN